VDNAKEPGFRSHPDFAVVRLLLGDIDADQCNITFSFGQDGQPHYISEPLNSPAMIQKVINTLDRNCGEGNYHFMVMSEFM